MSYDGEHRRPRSRQSPLALVAVIALVLGTGALFVAANLAPTGRSLAAEGDVLSVREECQQALTYPGRTNADKDWLRKCVHALATPTSSPTVGPTPTVAPSPTPAPSPTVGPTTPAPTTPAPTTPPPTTPPPSPSPSPTPSPTPPPGDEWALLRANAGPDGPLTPMACPAAGYVRLDTPGQVLQNVSIDGCDVAVMAPNVIVRNVKIVHTSPEMWAIYVGPGATGVQITDVEVHGRDRVLGSVQYAVYLVPSASATITRGNFWLCADCVQGEHVVLRDTWMHDFANIPPGVLRPEHDGSHVDGFQCNADCDGTIIEHNLIEVDQDQTGAVSLFQDFGVPRNVLVTRNWLRWAGWTIYGAAGTKGTPTNIRIVDNIVDRGQYGWLAYWNPNGAGNVCSNNRSSTGVALTC